MATKRKYDEDGLRLQTYERNRGKVQPLSAEDSDAIMSLCINSAKNYGGRQPIYPDTEEGFDRFRMKSVEYLDYVQQVNSDENRESRLILDYESWAVYCGVCRQTIWLYEKRGGEWTAFIRYMKELITAQKKQLMMTYKIPPVVGIFDLTNNSGYANTNKFEIGSVDSAEEEKRDSVEVIMARHRGAVLPAKPEL